MKGNLWTVIAIACALALLVPVAHGGLSDAAELQNASEDTTVDYDVNYSLANEPGDVYEYGEFNVTAGSTTLDRGTDYLVDETAGAIDWQNTTATTDGDAATVNYTYSVHDQTTQTQVSLLTTAGSWAGFLMLIVGMGYLVILMGGGSY